MHVRKTLNKKNEESIKCSKKRKAINFVGDIIKTFGDSLKKWKEGITFSLEINFVKKKMIKKTIKSMRKRIAKKMTTRKGHIKNKYYFVK